MKREYFKQNHPLRIMLSACVHLTDEDIERADPGTLFLGLIHLFWLKAQRATRRKGLDPLDALQEAFFEAHVAARRLDKKRSKEERRGYIISSCVWMMINWSMLEPRTHDPFRLPQRAHEKLRKIGKACDSWRKRHGTEPSTEELFTALKCKSSSSSSLRFYVDLYQALQQPMCAIQGIDTESNVANRIRQQTLGELLGQAHPTMTSLLDRAVIQQAFRESFAELTPREKTILIQHFGLSGTPPRTLQEIGDDYNVSKERIRQLEAQALQKLRAKIREVADWSSDEIVDALMAFDLEPIIPN